MYVYEDKRGRNAGARRLDSDYALTGSIFCTDRFALEQAQAVLPNAAGNLYVNTKPTGAVVGQQPFGGGRASGTNDKAGSMWNLIRWVSPRTIKETFVPPTDYRYPFLGPTAMGRTKESADVLPRAPRPRSGRALGVFARPETPR